MHIHMHPMQCIHDDIQKEIWWVRDVMLFSYIYYTTSLVFMPGSSFISSEINKV